jgi:hypothetical protein
MKTTRRFLTAGYYLKASSGWLCLAVTATQVAISAVLATTATGGVPSKTIATILTVGTYTITTMFIGM